MTEQKTEKKTYRNIQEMGRYLFWYTCLFVLVGVGVFVWFWKNGRSFCWTLDAVSQYVPKASYFITSMKEMFRQLLEGELAFPMYDFQLGLGDSIPLHLEPVYWLYLLFDESHIETAYGCLILLRFYLAGLSMSVFLRYFHYSRWQCLTGSMVYVFSGYGLYAGMRHSHFIIPMITLPLLLLSMEEIYRKKRWYLCTIFVALSLWCGYYFTYMNTLMMGMYFLIRFFFGEEKRSVKEFILRMRTIIASYLLGIGIANLTFFNTFADYLNSSRTGVTTKQRVDLWNYGSGWLKGWYQSFLTAEISPGKWMWLGFIPLSYLCVVLLFARKGNKTLKAAFLTGTLCSMVPVFAWIFSGFGNLNNRWCYAYACVISVITAKMAGELKNISKKEWIILLISILPYLYLGIGHMLLRKSYTTSVVIAGCGLLGTCLILFLLQHWKKNHSRIFDGTILMIVTVSLWVTGVYRFSNVFAGMASEFTKSGKVITKITNTPLQVVDELEDDTFYRVYSRKSNSSVQGASMLLGYKGAVYYSSTLTKSVIDFYREMGLTSWSLVRIRGFDSRGFLDSLACIKYQVPTSDSTEELPYGYHLVKEVLRNETYYQIYENEQALPLGYTYDQVITREELEKLDTANRQEAMLQAAVVEEIKEGDAEYRADSEELILTGKEVPITDIEYHGDISYDGEKIRVKEENASMTIWFEGLEHAETYLNLESLSASNAKKRWFYIESGDDGYEISYCYHGDYNAYNTKQEDYLFHLGYSQEGKTYCTIRFNKKCTLSVENISIFCQPMEQLDQYVEKRKEVCLENIKEGHNKLSGTIENEDEKLLVFSIPYQNGWSAYVDGQKVPIRKVNIMYMGINLEAGTHTVELRFELPGLRLSLMISALSLGIFAAALLIRRKRRYAEH